MEQNNRGHSVKECLGYGLIVLYGLCCFYLYYMQSIQPLDYNNRTFQSDLPYHISMIIDDGWYYSFTAYAYQILYLLGGKSTVLIALFLAVVSALTVWVTDHLLRTFIQLYIGKEGVPAKSLEGQLASVKATPISVLAALFLNFIMPFYVPGVGAYRYVSYQSGNLWHNSTYLCMRLLALLAFLVYLKIEKQYREKIDRRQWLLFMVLLVLCTGVKPSFLTVFAPVMAMKLLWDLCRKVSFKQIFLFGCSVLPACLVILWQNSVLFGQETGNGMTFQPWYTFSLHADRPKWSVVCSLAFPLVILLLQVILIKGQGIFQWFKDNKGYVFLWIMTMVGFLEALCLVETGTRSRDGNFLWGYCFAIFMIMVMSFAKWMELYRRSKESVLCRAGFCIAGVVGTYQIYCGIYFFVKLMMGITYFTT